MYKCKFDISIYIQPTEYRSSKLTNRPREKQIQVKTLTRINILTGEECFNKISKKTEINRLRQVTT